MEDKIRKKTPPFQFVNYLYTKSHSWDDLTEEEQEDFIAPYALFLFGLNSDVIEEVADIQYLLGALVYTNSRVAYTVMYQVIPMYKKAPFVRATKNKTYEFKLTNKGIALFSSKFSLSPHEIKYNMEEGYWDNRFIMDVLNSLGFTTKNDLKEYVVNF